MRFSFEQMILVLPYSSLHSMLSLADHLRPSTVANVLDFVKTDIDGSILTKWYMRRRTAETGVSAERMEGGMSDRTSNGSGA